MSQESQNYLMDLGSEVLTKALEAQRSAQKTTDAFDKGRQMAFYEVLSLMKQQADAFDLDDAAIGLKGVNLDQLLT